MVSKLEIFGFKSHPTKTKNGSSLHMSMQAEDKIVAPLPAYTSRKVR